LTLNHSTVTANIADSDSNDRGDGGGIATVGTFYLKNSLVAGNDDRSTPGYDDCCCYGTVSSQGYNLVGSDTGFSISGTGDQTTADARLTALADNGGPTWTHALLTGSPALDAIPNGVNGCGTTYTQDQRGQPRPSTTGGACDVGAYEARPFYIVKAVNSQTAAPGDPIIYTLTFSNSESSTATGVVITDIVPVSVTVSGVVSSGVAITDTGTIPGYVWEVQDLAPGQGGVITITGVLSAALLAGARVDNTAEIAANVGSTPYSSTARITVVGLVLRLPLDEAPGATAFADASGNGNNGACSGDACPAAGEPGRLGQAAQFDGADDVITVADALSLRSNHFSLSLWLRWDGLGTNNVNFLTAKGLGNVELHTGGDAGTNGLRFIPAGHPYTTVDASNVITTGWNHVAATYDGSAAYLYVNGTQVGSHTGITTTNNLLEDTTPFHVGRRSDASFPFDGRIDDMRLYNRVLSAGEIAALAAFAPEITVAPLSLDFGD
jgi:uncharacterized repeat protein (TIGR01451 family)